MSFDKQHVMGSAASERAAAIKYIDGNFGLLSGMTSATDRMIQCYIAGALEASSRQEERLRSALDEAAKALDGIYHYTFEPLTNDYIRRDAQAAAKAISAALEPPHAKDAADV